MFKSGLATVRKKEDLILNDEPMVCVKGEIVQYLLNHQINGIRFLYRNYKIQSACILNDEGGSGKCFQCVAFLDAIMRSAECMKMLIICQRKQSLDHWQYHIDCFLENRNSTIADNGRSTQLDDPPNAITIASVDYVLSNLSSFIDYNYDCLIFHDQHLQTTADSFTQLKKIKATYRVALCSGNLMNELAYFYELLQFCHKKGPLLSNSPNTTLSLDEFRLKFGCSDNKSISKRNQAFRQKNLLNTCNDFYLRRLCMQLGSQFPPINADDFQSNFDAWKTITCDTVSLEVSQTEQTDFTPIELLPAPSNTHFDPEPDAINNDDESIFNVACANFSDFDTQMSPLFYSDSENSLIGDNDTSHAIDIPANDKSQLMTPDIVCNQEHAAKTRSAINVTTETNVQCVRTPTKRNHKMHDKESPISKRLAYKKLEIQIKTNPNDKIASKQNTYLFRTRRQASSTSSDDNVQRSNKMRQSIRLRSASSTSDVQIISQTADLSPISVSSTENLLVTPKKITTENEAADNCASTSGATPDLFNSFTGAKSLATDQVNSPSDPSNKLDKSETNTLHDVFGAPDECDDIDLLSNTNVDIFEITKNSVFDNILCSANDKITPLKSAQNAMTGGFAAGKSQPSTSCLSGLRVVLRKSGSNQIQNDLTPQLQPFSTFQHSPSTDSDVVDLTLNESQKIIEISSEDSARDVEKTPERKQDLTPSTRSCVKRHSDDKSIDDRKRKSPFSRLGWLSTSKTSPKSETPQSRRRLDKWKHRMDVNSVKLNDGLTVTKPRNLSKEFKSKTNANQRRNIPSTSTAKSPTIFSDQD